MNSIGVEDLQKLVGALVIENTLLRKALEEATKASHTEPAKTNGAADA